MHGLHDWLIFIFGAVASPTIIFLIAVCRTDWSK